MTIDVLYAALGLALFMFVLAGLLRLDARYRRWKIERRRRARGGDITEELARQLRFYDDEHDPKGLLW